MLTRIVKMSFDPSKTEEFLKLFQENQHRIRGFEGCHSVELLRDIQEPQNFFTYSHWCDEEALETYRLSEVFKEIWGKTKPLFRERAQAWSVNKVY